MCVTFFYRTYVRTPEIEYEGIIYFRKKIVSIIRKYVRIKRIIIFVQSGTWYGTSTMFILCFPLIFGLELCYVRTVEHGSSIF